ARLPPFPLMEPLERLHLSAIRQRGESGRHDPQPLQDWPYPHPPAPPGSGHAKNGHDPSRGDGWYACISCAKVPIDPVEPTGQETGIDLGVESFATLADGTVPHNPRCYQKVEAYLRRCQRRVARRKQGSNRRKNAWYVRSRRAGPSCSRGEWT